jgi:hypothetical protein
MNRLTPLITPVPDRSGPARFAAIDPLAALPEWTVTEDARHFLIAFAGGFVFFLTLLS